MSKQRTIFSSLRAILSNVSPQRRRRLIFVIGLMLLGALAELVSLGAILPFLAVAADPERAIKAAGPLGSWLQNFGIKTTFQIVATTAVLFAIAALGAMAIRLALVWVNQRYVFGIAKELSVAVYSRTLHQPYSYHTSLNSSETLAAVNKAQLVTFQLLMPLMQAATASLISIFIVAGLILIDPLIALLSGLGFATIYLIVMLTTRNIMRRQGKIIAQAQSDRMKAVGEGLGGIRDILLDRSQGVFIARFDRIETKLRRAQGINGFIAQSPRLMVEGIGITLIVVLALVLSIREGGLLSAIPVLGALALGAQRLLPLMQQTYAGWAAFLGNSRMLDDILDVLGMPEAAEFGNAHPSKLSFTHEIVLDRINFAYPSGDRPALEGVVLTIPKGARVGFAGKTGSGKSTLIDIVLGLLVPTSGRMLVDGMVVTDANRSAWQAQIAHVPQAIYLADATVAENIAFGVPAAKIDWERVREATEQAELDEVVSALPQGYETFVGERGVRLSGGQRQRIGIARALYKRASVLVFDEATSALDGATEAAVMAAINRLSKELTVLIVAHRLSTLEDCDMVVQLEDGRVKAQDRVESAPRSLHA